MPSELEPVALTEPQAATYIAMSRSFLRKARMNGKRHRHTPAPPYCRIGRKILYLRADLDAWLRRHRIECSTTREET